MKNMGFVIIIFALFIFVGCKKNEPKIILEKFDVTVVTSDSFEININDIKLDSKESINLLKNHEEIKLVIIDNVIKSVAGIENNDNKEWELYINNTLFEGNFYQLVIKDNDQLKFVLKVTPIVVEEFFSVKVVNQKGEVLTNKVFVIKDNFNLLEAVKLDNDIKLEYDENYNITKLCNIDLNSNEYLDLEIYINDILIDKTISEIKLNSNDQIVFKIVNTYVEVEEVIATSENYDLRTGYVTNINYTVLPANASNKKVTFRSTDNNVLSVDEFGKVTAKYKGVASIIITSDGVETSIEFIVRHKKLIEMTPEEQNKITDDEFIELYDEYLEDEKLMYANEVARIVNHFQNVPNETIENLDIVRLADIRGIYITLESSNEISISKLGEITRKSKDVLVQLTYTVKSPNETVTIMKEVIVKGFYMPDMRENKLTFAYLFNDTFKGFRDEDIKKLDVINYGFAGIDINTHKVNITGLKTNLSKILKLREQGIRVVLCIGGWGVDGFSQAVSSSETRRILIDSILEVINMYDFDGIDLDWEYPGRTAGGLIGSDPVNDKRNFSLLLKELREALDLINEDLILSAAVPAGGSAGLYEVNELNEYLTYLHLMTYDLSKPGTTSHHTALYKSNYTASSIIDTVITYNNLGFDKSKMVVGAAFYGYKSELEDGVTSDTGLGAITKAGGTISYTNIKSLYLNNSNFELKYDPVNNAPYLFDGKTFISFDNEVSIKDKVNYALNENLAGVMFWDYNNDQTGELLNAIYEAYKLKLNN